MRALRDFAVVMSLVYASALAAEPTAPEAADPAKGQRIAAGVCAACHGPDGNSAIPANPVLAGQVPGYIEIQLAAFKAGTRPSPIMQGMAASLSPEDMRNVAAWFGSQVPKGDQASDKAMADRGQQIWRGGLKSVALPACAGCHGAAGHGLPIQYPRLAGQHSDLSVGWLKAFASGTRPNEVMRQVAAKLSENDMKALAQYIAGLQ